jgi:hypothetical protein
VSAGGGGRDGGVKILEPAGQAENGKERLAIYFPNFFILYSIQMTKRYAKIQKKYSINRAGKKADEFVKSLFSPRSTQRSQRKKF